MTLTPYDVEKIENFRGFKKTSNYKILEEFINSGMKCAVIDDYPHKNANCCVSCLRASVTRFGMLNIGIIKRKDKVYLVRND